MNLYVIQRKNFWKKFVLFCFTFTLLNLKLSLSIEVYLPKSKYLFMMTFHKNSQKLCALTGQDAQKMKISIDLNQTWGLIVGLSTYNLVQSSLFMTYQKRIFIG